MESKYSEQYWRVDFETAKLLKQTGFIETCEMYWYDNVPIKVTNTNKGMPSNKASAPLIAAALEWCKDRGYKFHALTVYNTKTDWSKNVICNYNDEKEVNIAFIQAVCNHLISK